jgi:hypothetical protein
MRGFTTRVAERYATCTSSSALMRREQSSLAGDADAIYFPVPTSALFMMRA